jgi:hypothetical protein
LKKPDDEEEREIAWLAMPIGVPVVDLEGTGFGASEALLGDEGDDIFHGIVVRLRGGALAELRADRIPRITTRKVYTNLAPGEADQLPPFGR